jgi:AmiR/NasT family two-component response regulator
MLSPGHLADGLDLAEMAMMAVLELQSHAAPGELGAGLSDGWAHRAAVHQATGLVATQLDTKLADALARIRAHAFAEDRTIYSVAADIVSGALRLPR